MNLSSRVGTVDNLRTCRCLVSIYTQVCGKNHGEGEWKMMASMGKSIMTEKRDEARILSNPPQQEQLTVDFLARPMLVQ